MWLRPSSILLDGCGSKIQKVNRCRPAVSNKNILVSRQEFFFTKADPVQSITNIILLDLNICIFWICIIGYWLMLLSWMFISSYTTIYFFVKKIFLKCLHFSEYNIRMSLYLYWLRKGQSIKCIRSWWGMVGVIQNARSYIGYRDAMPHINSP